MKNKNKLIAILVAIVLIVSIFIVGTVANAKNTSVTVSVDKTELSAGESATVTVKVSADYPVATASIPVFYDKTLVDVSNVTATLSGYDVKNVTTDATATDSAKIYANTELDSTKYGFVLATYIGGAGDTVTTLENATVFTFKITAKENVSGNAVVKCANESAKVEENIEGMLYFGTTTSGTTINSIPENVEGVVLTNATANVVIKSADTTVIAKDDKETVIDNENKYIYGITPGDNVEDYIQVNNGSFEVVANASGYKNGTGATVNIKNSSGTVVDTYTIIIFGDFNGDCNINGVDEMTISQYTSGTTSVLLDVALVSADVNGDGATNGVDEMLVSQYTSGTTSSISVNPYSK